MSNIYTNFQCTHLYKKNEWNTFNRCKFWKKRRVTNQLSKLYTKMICKIEQILFVECHKMWNNAFFWSVSLGENDYAFTFDRFNTIWSLHLHNEQFYSSKLYIYNNNNNKNEMGCCDLKFPRTHHSHLHTHSHSFNCFLEIFM